MCYFMQRTPVIISGKELNTPQAFADAAELATLLGAGVFQESVPYSTSFSTSHPHYLGALTRNQDNVRKTLDPFDLVLCLGADLLRMSVYSPTEPLPAHSRVVHVSDRSWELGKNYRTELAVQANVAETLPALLGLLRSRTDANYQAQAQARSQALAAQNWTLQRQKSVTQVLTQSAARPMSAATFAMHISEQLTPDVIVVEEALTSTFPLPQFLHQHHPDSFLVWPVVAWVLPFRARWVSAWPNLLGPWWPLWETAAPCMAFKAFGQPCISSCPSRMSLPTTEATASSKNGLSPCKALTDSLAWTWTILPLTTANWRSQWACALSKYPTLLT